MSNTLEYSNEGIRRDFARRGIAIVTVHDTMLKCRVASELNVGNHKDGLAVSAVQCTSLTGFLVVMQTNVMSEKSHISEAGPAHCNMAAFRRGLNKTGIYGSSPCEAISSVPGSQNS